MREAGSKSVIRATIVAAGVQCVISDGTALPPSPGQGGWNLEASLSAGGVLDKNRRGPCEGLGERRGRRGGERGQFRTARSSAPIAKFFEPARAHARAHGQGRAAGNLLHAEHCEID